MTRPLRVQHPHDMNTIPTMSACTLLFLLGQAAIIHGKPSAGDVINPPGLLLQAGIHTDERGAVLSSLGSLGARSCDDVSFLRESDLVTAGLSLVNARRLLHACGQLTDKRGALELAPEPAAELTYTFGSAGKAVALGPGETTLFEHNCSSSAPHVCVLRHAWFGGNWAGYDTTRLRYYIDGETRASIDGQFFLLHGTGFSDQAAPWSSGALFGKTGQPSGIFNTFQIPFGDSVRVTAQASNNGTERFWWIFRGTENEAGVQLAGGKVLPAAARLRLHTHEGVEQPARSEISLISSHDAGAVLMTTLSVDAQSENFLEGEVRVYKNNAVNKSCSYGICASMTMSSGTEDYFLGTYYFNRGMYHNPLAGLSHLAKPTLTDKNWQFSAYRRHDHDYLIFPRGGFNMTWRCGEPGAGFPTACRTFSYVLAYHW